jgi:hypothetical protein
MSFRDRLLLVISTLEMNRNSFSERLGYKNNSYIYEYTREDPPAKEPGFDFFQKLSLAKTSINLDWLLTGDGDMLIKKGTPATNNSDAGELTVARLATEKWESLFLNEREKRNELQKVLEDLVRKMPVVDQSKEG